MNNDKDKISNYLKEAHDEIEPLDSWQALRKRIDMKIESSEKETGPITKLHNNIVFWRRAALAAAACLVITSALLIYVAFNNKSENIFRDQELSQNQLKQLSQAFTQVQEMFNQNCPWIVINSTGQGDIGVENQQVNPLGAKQIVVLRLALNLESEKNTPQYFDIVTYDNQLVNFDAPVPGGSDVSITLKPVIADNNKIQVEINTQLKNGIKSNNTVTIADDSFKTLANIKSDGNWINIHATGQSI